MFGWSARVSLVAVVATVAEARGTEIESQRATTSERERAESGWLDPYVCVSPSHTVHAPPNAPQAKSRGFKYTHTSTQVRLIRIRARADSRCDGAALTFYLSALMAFPFFQGSTFFFSSSFSFFLTVFLSSSSFLFFTRNPERRIPSRLAQSGTRYDVSCVSP